MCLAITEQMGPARQAVLSCEGPHAAESCQWDEVRLAGCNQPAPSAAVRDQISKSPALVQASGTELSDKAL